MRAANTPIRALLCLSALLALCGATSTPSAATLVEEQQRLATLLRQITQLQNVNSDIDSNLAALAERLAAIKPDAEVERELVNARHAVTAAEQQLAQKPGAESQGLLDNARFKLKLAERRYQKANDEPVRLRQEQAELTEAKSSNERQINYLNARVADQQQLIASMQKEQQKASERSLQEQEQLLRKEQQQRQQAQEEIERLKALLAKKEAEEAALLQRQEEEALASAAAATAAAAEPEPTPTAAASSYPANSPAPAATAPQANAAAPAANAAPGIELVTDRTQVAQLAARAASAAGKGNKLNKILHFKSYNGDELVKRSSHSMQNLDNTLFRSELELRGGKSEFVVGGESWWLDIPRSADGVTHVVLLDLTDPDHSRLLLFASGLAP